MTYLLLGFSGALLFGQFLFKIVALRGTFGLALLHDHIGVALFVGALGIYGPSTVAWVFVLQTMPLSTAYPFLAFTFVLVPAASVLFLGEKVGANYGLGILLVVAGLVLIALP